MCRNTGVNLYSRWDVSYTCSTHVIHLKDHTYITDVEQLAMYLTKQRKTCLNLTCPILKHWNNTSNTNNNNNNKNN